MCIQICIYIYIYIYIHAYTHTSLDLSLSLYIYIHTCIPLSLSIYIYIYIYTQLDIYTYVYIYIYVSVDVYRYVYIYIYTHKHIYIYMYACVQLYYIMLRYVTFRGARPMPRLLLFEGRIAPGQRVFVVNLCVCKHWCVSRMCCCSMYSTHADSYLLKRPKPIFSEWVVSGYPSFPLRKHRGNADKQQFKCVEMWRAKVGSQLTTHPLTTRFGGSELMRGGLPPYNGIFPHLSTRDS